MLTTPVPITPRLLQVVAALYTLREPTTVPGIAAAAKVPTATAQAMVARLWQAGWVCRAPLYGLHGKGPAPYGYQLTEIGQRAARSHRDPLTTSVPARRVSVGE